MNSTQYIAATFALSAMIALIVYIALHALVWSWGL